MGLQSVKVRVDEQEQVLILEYADDNQIYTHQASTAIALGRKVLSLNVMEDPEEIMLLAFELQKAEILLANLRLLSPQEVQLKPRIEEHSTLPQPQQVQQQAQQQAQQQQQQPQHQLEEYQLHVANILKKDYGYMHSDAVEVLHTYLPSVRGLGQHWTPEELADMLHASWINDQNLVRG